ISTDTGCFRYSNTTDRTLLIASKLVELGADNKKLNKLLFETVTKAQFEIERKAFETINFYYDGKIATMKITQKMLLETGATPDDIDNISSLPRKIEGVEAAITLRENPDGSIKVSARSGEKVDVSKVCKDVCSGGGHKRAAGGTIFSDIEKAEKLFIEYFKEVF
ncbi:MAG: bifunctional oligoribonuclease/PAP phosphatase NrnA, partial [Clostridia bacterium]|nr:bifunctional oligoribonuclease/PAP phosphatase NrnA [Clostridia bacterium]